MNKIVVFEDGKSISMHLRKSFDCIVTRMPSDAVAIANKGGIMMLIVDISVYPDYSKWMKKILMINTPPIIIAISNRDKSEIKRLKKNGFNMLFTRPLKIQTIVNIIINKYGGAKIA